VVLPIPDLTGIIAAIDRNTNMLQNLVDELVRMNEHESISQEEMDQFKATMETQYRDRITDLEKRLDNASPFPGINIPTVGGLGGPPGPASPE
jgi:hypothetical protein